MFSGMKQELIFLNSDYSFETLNVKVVKFYTLIRALVWSFFHFTAICIKIKRIYKENTKFNR